MLRRPCAARALMTEADELKPSEIEKIGRFLGLSEKAAHRTDSVIAISSRIGADVLAVRTALATIELATLTMPVLPGAWRAYAAGAAVLSGAALVGATTDIAVQMTKLVQILSADPRTMTESQLKEISEHLDKITDPIDALVEKLLEVIDKMGIADADTLAFVKAAHEFREKHKERVQATGVLNKYLAGLAELEAAQELMSKVPPILTRKNREQQDRYRDLQKVKPDYPGVDYPNPPSNSGPPGDDGGTMNA